MPGAPRPTGMHAMTLRLEPILHPVQATREVFATRVFRAPGRGTPIEGDTADVRRVLSPFRMNDETACVELIRTRN